MNRRQFLSLALAPLTPIPTSAKRLVAVDFETHRHCDYVSAYPVSLIGGAGTTAWNMKVLTNSMYGKVGNLRGYLGGRYEEV